MSEEQISEEVFQTIIDSIDFTTDPYDFSSMIIEAFDDHAGDIFLECKRKVESTDEDVDVKNIVDDYIKDFPKNYYDFMRMIGRRTFDGLLEEVLDEKFSNHLLSIYEEKFGEKKDYEYFNTFEKTDLIYDFDFDIENICDDYIESRYEDICNKLMSLIDCNSPV